MSSQPVSPGSVLYRKLHLKNEFTVERSTKLRPLFLVYATTELVRTVGPTHLSLKNPPCSEPRMQDTLPRVVPVSSGVGKSTGS